MSRPDTREIATPALPGAPGAAGAVDVDLRRLRCRVADDVRQIADVDAARRDVRRHQQAQLSLLDPPHRELARRLGEVPGDLVGVEAAPLEIGGHEADVVLGVAEDDGALGILVLDDPREGGVLLLGGGDDEEVLDRLGRLLALGHGDELRVPEEDPRQRPHLLGNRRREEAGLPLLGEVRVDLPHVGPEAQREQLVGLVEDQGPDGVEVEATGAEVVEHAARSAHDHVGAGFDAFDLLGVADAAVDGDAADPLVLAQRFELAAHLVRQLAGRGHHQGLALIEVGVELGDEGDAEGAGLPAPGDGLDDEVRARAHQGDDLGLDRHGLGPAQVADPALDLFGQFPENRLKARSCAAARLSRLRTRDETWCKTQARFSSHGTDHARRGPRRREARPPVAVRRGGGADDRRTSTTSSSTSRPSGSSTPRASSPPPTRSPSKRRCARIAPCPASTPSSPSRTPPSRSPPPSSCRR